MRGLKKVTQIGNDPIIQNLEGNIKVAKFSLATSESKDTNGQNQTITDWHNIVSWRSLADLAEKYLHKGSLIYLEGKHKNRTYEDKDGQKRYVTEIITESFLMLDKASHEAIEGFLSILLRLSNHIVV
jgi:single-strand DNA-binding protein